ncbi:MAG: hypothetical protein M0P64_03985 [Candidatus Pacebacteria bacterium]|jgi:hypothetical protein|nr:hypothetical protein [Candidatus Paceibacterota bacterium]
MDGIEKVFAEANRRAGIRMRRWKELLEGELGKALARRASKEKSNPAFVEANRLAAARMKRFDFALRNK